MEMDKIALDLAKSGLTPADMHVRPLGESEKAATNTGNRTLGYVIPYFTAMGDPLAFYRVKILTPDTENGTRYKQPKKTPNHIYFPPGFHDSLVSWLRTNQHARIVILTEGEKKAACAVKLGIPACAFGGVDSWRSRTLVLPAGTEFSAASPKSAVKAKLPSADPQVDELSTLAKGMGDLVDLITQYQLTAVIIYDSDRLGTLKADVQRAATSLGYELRFLGIPSHRIKQLVLPGKDSVQGKVGLDDYLTDGENAEQLLARLVEFTRSLERVVTDPKAFPKHPNPKGFINLQLENHLSRKVAQQIALIVLAELDARGMRLRDAATGHPFYYDGSTHKLMPAVILDSRGEPLHESAFGTLLYQEYALSGNDRKVLGWLASQFTGEEPIKDVKPRRVVTLITEKEDALNPDGIAIQASDSSYLAIGSDRKKPVELCVNGAKGILFEQGQVEPLDVDRVLEYFDEFNDEVERRGFLVSWWAKTLGETNLGRTVGDSSDGVTVGELSEQGRRMRVYAELLFYVSPYLNRWRGLQLPLEVMTGEAGSGKSSLYMLRLTNLTGRPALRNLPNDLRDWFASVTHTGGLHVFDNVHFADKQMRQRLSDEYCRLITEPFPHVEMHKLYTEMDLVRVPVDATFAITALEMPFVNADLIQRAAVFKAVALGKAPDGDWVKKQLEYRGGREAWVAHQMVFLHRFLRLAQREWSDDFKTEHRLAHLEQVLTLAGRVLNLHVPKVSGHEHTTLSGQTSASVAPAFTIGKIIKETQEQVVAEVDWTLSGLKEFVLAWTRAHPGKGFTTEDVVAYCEYTGGYQGNHLLSSERRLGRYMSSNQGLLQRMLNIRISGKTNNRLRWVFIGIEVEAIKAQIMANGKGQTCEAPSVTASEGGSAATSNGGASSEGVSPSQATASATSSATTSPPQPEPQP